MFSFAYLTSRSALRLFQRGIPTSVAIDMLSHMLLDAQAAGPPSNSSITPKKMHPDACCACTQWPEDKWKSVGTLTSWGILHVYFTA